MQHIPRKRFGQNFLQDAQVIQRILQCIAPKKSDALVEIGPGLGALTQPLLEQAGSLSVVELDRDIVPKLKEKFSHYPAFHIYQADALKFDFSTLVKNSQTLRIIGNLPYNISTPLLFHLLEFTAHIEDMHFMLQKEVVERITAQPDSRTYGQLSVILQQQFVTEHLFNVSPSAFIPAPKVESAIIRLAPHRTAPFEIGDIAIFRKTVKQAFSQRRKTIRNTLKPLLTEAELEQCSIDPSARAETIPPKGYARLSAFISAKQC